MLHSLIREHLETFLAHARETSEPAWLAPAWGGRSVVPIWTQAPIVHVTDPGQLAARAHSPRIRVRSAGKLIGGLERGALVDTTMDVFESEWLPAAFARAREEVRGREAKYACGLIGRLSFEVVALV